jgi:hypothetical protein
VSYRVVYTITGTSAVTPGLDTFGEIGRTGMGLDAYESVTIFAILNGNTGGTLDAYVQMTLDGLIWFDWCHFAQLPAGAAEQVRVAAATRPQSNSTLKAIGRDGTPALVANSILNTDWGVALRLVTVSSAASTVGAQQTLIVTATRRPGALTT